MSETGLCKCMRYVCKAHTVDILSRIDQFYDLLFVKMLGKRSEKQDAVNIFIPVAL